MGRLNKEWLTHPGGHREDITDGKEGERKKT